MGSTQNTVTVNYPIDGVYDATISAVRKINNMEIDSMNDMMHTISVKVRISLLSWGESMLITLNSIDKDSTQISIASTAKQLVDFGKNNRNIVDIMNAISTQLKRRDKPSYFRY